MWIDTHCHLDALEFKGQSLEFASKAVGMGVDSIVIPAVHRANFETVEILSQQHHACYFSLGIHPMYVATSNESDLLTLRESVSRLMTHNPHNFINSPTNKFVAIGEIGLDYFVPALTCSPLKEKQEFFYIEQLKIAKEFELPVLLHVRRSQDQVLKQLRRFKLVGGIAHAFNGSQQQAEAFIQLGFTLGFGGAMTFTRALQIRRLAAALPKDSIVLETDAPDIAPRWVYPGINSPGELVQIGHELAALRGISIEEAAQQTTANAHRVLPRLRSTIAP